MIIYYYKSCFETNHVYLKNLTPGIKFVIITESCINQNPQLLGRLRDRVEFAIISFVTSVIVSLVTVLCWYSCLSCHYKLRECFPPQHYKDLMMEHGAGKLFFTKEF